MDLHFRIEDEYSFFILFYEIKPNIPCSEKQLEEEKIFDSVKYISF